MRREAMRRAGASRQEVEMRKPNPVAPIEKSCPLPRTGFFYIMALQDLNRIAVASGSECEAQGCAERR